jgi:ketosteroid isomerase-like protein
MGRHIDLWLEGWRRGDAQMVLSAVSEDFVYEDAIDGRFAKAEFAAYLEQLFASEATAEGFETITDVMRCEHDGEETAWGWWKLLAGAQEGAGLVKARAGGVYFERVAYYVRPDETVNSTEE